MNLSDYCSQNPDSPVAWNYRHISRYPNLRAAEQWLQAMVNAEIENKRFHHFIDLYEKTGIDKHLLTASASNKACAEWEKVAHSFHQLLYIKEDVTDAVIVSGGEIVEVQSLLYKQQNDDDEFPF